MTHPVVLVSGASRGIGEAVARALAARGHRVALAARDAAALERIAAEIGGLAVPMDVCDAASVDAGPPGATWPTRWTRRRARC